MSTNQDLLSAWSEAVGGHSFTHQMVKHPLFSEIVARGNSILWDVFVVYEHDAWIGWSSVLRAITGATPALSAGTIEHEGQFSKYNVCQLRDDWLRWGRANGWMAAAEGGQG